MFLNISHKIQNRDLKYKWVAEVGKRIATKLIFKRAKMHVESVFQVVEQSAIQPQLPVKIRPSYASLK